jgi:CHAT domain-containing protein
VADDLGDVALASAARLALGDLLHALGQHDASEAVLQELLAQASGGPVQWDARFTLASILSETDRPRAAAALQETLIAELGERDERVKSVLWSNYANSLRLIGELDRATTALDTAWQWWTRANPSPPDKPSTEFVRLKLLFGQLARERGDLASALNYLDEAQAGGDPAVFGLEQVRIAELKAATLLAAQSYGPAADLLAVATQNLRAILVQGHSVESWESLFRRWSSLDEMAVHAEARGAIAGHDQERALLRAETAKGRVMSWLSTRNVAAAARVLDPQRQLDALARARAWLAARPGRCVVSLFAGSRGVGLFAVGDGAAVDGAWLDDVDYAALREGVFLPFEQAADDALSQGDAALARVSSALLEHQLAQVGSWLWRALPSLAEGGSELILLPHRVLRALPLAHAMLPTGRRLSELFDSVWTAPTLELAFAEAPARECARSEIQAVVDADGSLPFAACEALVSTDLAHVHWGPEASTQAVADVLGGPGIALVSMHGESVPDDPFAQRIVTADGSLQLRDLLLQDTPVRAPVVLLGVCEAGQQRRSVSDEPFGFPAMLLQCGANAVLAPLWKVDDFASLHFMTRLAASLRQGVVVERAAASAAGWMRNASPSAVIRATDEIVRTVESRLEANDALLGRIRARVAVQRAWLDTLPRDARPFGGAIDWAAFQVTRQTFTGAHDA